MMLAKNVSFNIDKGFYSADTIDEFDELHMFTGEREQISSISERNIAKEDEKGTLFK